MAGPEERYASQPIDPAAKNAAVSGTLPSDSAAVESSRRSRLEREHKTATHKLQERRENDGAMNFGMRPEFNLYRGHFPAAADKASPNSSLQQSRTVQFQEQLNREVSLANKRERERRGATHLDEFLARLSTVLPQHEIEELRKELAENARLDATDALSTTPAEIALRTEEQRSKQIGADIPLHLHVREQSSGQTGAGQDDHEISNVDPRKAPPGQSTYSTPSALRHILPRELGAIAGFLARDRNDSYGHYVALVDSRRTELVKVLEKAAVPHEASFAALTYFDRFCGQVLTQKIAAVLGNGRTQALSSGQEEYTALLMRGEGELKFRLPRAMSYDVACETAANIVHDFAVEKALLEARHACQQRQREYPHALLQFLIASQHSEPLSAVAPDLATTEILEARKDLLQALADRVHVKALDVGDALMMIGGALAEIVPAAERSLSAAEKSDLACAVIDSMEQFDFSEAHAADFAEAVTSALRRAEKESRLTHEERSELFERVHRTAVERLLSECDSACRAPRVIDVGEAEIVRISNSAERRYYWIERLGQACSDGSASLALYEQMLGPLSADDSVRAALTAMVARLRERDVREGLIAYEKKTSALRDDLAGRGIVFEETGGEMSARMRLAEPATLRAVAQRLFNPQSGSDFELTALHRELLAAANPHLVSSLLGGTEAEIVLPAGTTLNVSGLAAVKELELRCLVEAETHLELRGESPHGMRDLISGIKAQLEIARYSERLAAVGGSYQRWTKALALNGDAGQMGFETEFVSDFKALEEELRGLPREVPQSVREELFARLKSMESSAAASFGLALLNQRRGDDAGVAFEHALRVTETLLARSAQFSAAQRASIRMLRVQLYERLADAAVHGAAVASMRRMRDQGAKADDCAAIEVRLLGDIFQRTDQARTELALAHEEHGDQGRSSGELAAKERAISARGYARTAHMYRQIGDDERAFEALNSQAAILLGLPASEQGIFHFPDTDYQIDEATGKTVQGWWFGYDTVRGLSAERLGKLRDRFLALGEEEQRAFVHLLPGLMSAALETKDEQKQIERAFCLAAVGEALLLRGQRIAGPYDAAVDLDREIIRVLQAQCCFAFGSVNQHEQARAYAVAAVREARTRLEKINLQSAADIQIKDLALRQIEQEELAMLMANAQFSNDARHLDAFSAAVARIVDGHQAAVEESRQRRTAIDKLIGEEVAARGVASAALVAHSHALESEISRRLEHCAGLKVEQALLLLRQGASVQARETLQAVASNYSREVPWVVDKVASILDEKDHGALAAGLQQVLREANSSTIGPIADGVSYLGAIGAGGAAGFAVAGPGGAAVGALVSPLVVWTGFKSYNLYRGSGRIHDAFSSGLSDITLAGSMFDTALLAVDVVNMIGPLKTAQSLLTGAAREGAEATLASVAKEVSAEEMRRLLTQQTCRMAVSDGIEFGGRWLLILNASAIGGPLGIEAGRVMLDESLSAAEKQARLLELSGHAARIVALAGSQWAAQYYMMRLAFPQEVVVRTLLREEGPSQGAGRDAISDAAVPESALESAHTSEVKPNPGIDVFAAVETPREIAAQVGHQLRSRIEDIVSLVERLEIDVQKPANSRVKEFILSEISEQRTRLNDLLTQARSIIADVRARTGGTVGFDGNDPGPLPFDPPDTWSPDADGPGWQGGGGGRAAGQGGRRLAVAEPGTALVHEVAPETSVAVLDEVPGLEPHRAPKTEAKLQRATQAPVRIEGGPPFDSIPLDLPSTIIEVPVSDSGSATSTVIVVAPSVPSVAAPPLRAPPVEALPPQIEIAPAPVIEVPLPHTRIEPAAIPIPEIAPIPEAPITPRVPPAPIPELAPRERELALPREILTPDEIVSSESGVQLEANPDERTALSLKSQPEQEARHKTKTEQKTEEETRKRRRMWDGGEENKREEKIFPVAHRAIPSLKLAEPPISESVVVTLERCAICTGTGRVHCSRCSGSHRHMCFLCNGSGQTHAGGAMHLCIECDGEGKVTCVSCGEHGMLRCTACGGTGGKRKVVT